MLVDHNDHVLAYQINAAKRGIAHAEAMKVGDVFRGGLGEANKQGLEGIAASMFCTGYLMIWEQRAGSACSYYEPATHDYGMCMVTHIR